MANRKTAMRMERELRAHGVYKPYVGNHDSYDLAIESYPLTAYVRSGGVDPEHGPFSQVHVTDCTLPRIGVNNCIVSPFRVYLGSPLIQRIAETLKEFHGAAYARAKEQDAAA